MWCGVVSIQIPWRSVRPGPEAFEQHSVLQVCAPPSHTSRTPGLRLDSRVACRSRSIANAATMKLAAGLLPALALSAQALTLPFDVQSRFNVNDVLALVSKLFPFDVTLEAAQKLSVAAEDVLAMALGFQTTRQDLDDGKCSDLYVIFARGTQEPGNVGALVGPPFFKALEDALGSSHTMAVQGVDYEATVTDYLEGGDPEGSQEM